MSNETRKRTRTRRGGVARFTATRVGVSQRLGDLRDGQNIDDFAGDLPNITQDQAGDALHGKSSRKGEGP